MTPATLCFVAESGTDVRLADGLACAGGVTVVARRIVGGTEISHPPGSLVTLLVGPAGRLRFALHAAWHVWTCRRGYRAVVVQGYGLAALGVNLAGRLAHLPTTMLVCSPVEAYYECRRLQPMAGKRYRSWEALLMRVVAMVNARVGQRYAVLSAHLADVVAGHRTSLPVEIVPVYGVDTQLFAPVARSKGKLRSELGLPVTGSLIFFSSRIAPEKDSETLLQAVAHLINGGADLWVLHRSGGYLGFAKRAEELGVGHRVIATDAVHPHRQLPADYQASDLCVQASLAEGLGFSPLEALACEVPVVATAVGGLRETIRDGETGWTYPVGDVRALADQIQRALSDRPEAERRARLGRQMVMDRFDRSAVFSRFMDVVAPKHEMNPAVRPYDALSAAER